MSYRPTYSAPRYAPRPAQQIRTMAEPPLSRLMIAGLMVFIMLSLVVLLAGRVPFTPQPAPVTGNTYRSYVTEARTLLNSYGYTMEGKVHIPIDRAMDLIVERGLPVRE
ncbi:hypothetical protein [Chloroflexus aggregans]|uniref:Uncharacterized protein n=1 Tax=Chloroflexus aggregans (strain MD-66 / DSM 9485) TaxID=326427 RepID=B8G8V0_CHLAD|nr:hypothetical protein [Chloroflexus aggregans]ACL26225.1 conserved hypothetical protein [Chloroflexus aggregans DSM 9485]